jgi:hypothetical protein
MNNPWDTSKPTFTWPNIPEPTETGLAARPDWLTDELVLTLVKAGFPPDQDGMLLLHKHAKEQLDYWKEKEMEYRKICANFLVPDKNEGMNNVELGNGFIAKVGIKFNYKLDNDNDVVWAGLTKIESLGNEGKFVAERLVSWTPNFLLTEYRQLQEDAEKDSPFAKDALKIINEFLVITDAAPTLAIQEPKQKKGKK